MRSPATGQRPAIDGALQHQRLATQARAVSGKLARLPLPLAEAFLAGLTARLRPLFPAGLYRSELPACLAGLTVVVLDGKKIKRAAQRLLAIRGRPGKVFGGKLLVAYLPAHGLAVVMAADPIVGEPKRVDEVVAGLPAAAGRRLTVAEGSQGPRVYQYAEVWVWFSAEGLPGPRERLLMRRSLGQEPELKYHCGWAPAEVPLLKLAQVRATRGTIEDDIRSGNGECGLDEYETRGWVGWHHHTTLSMLALSFLVLQRVRWGKRGADERARGACPPGPPAEGAGVGHRQDPAVVGVAPRAKPAGCRQPPQASTLRATPARSEK